MGYEEYEDYSTEYYKPQEEDATVEEALDIYDNYDISIEDAYAIANMALEANLFKKVGSSIGTARANAKAKFNDKYRPYTAHKDELFSKYYKAGNDANLRQHAADIAKNGVSKYNAEYEDAKAKSIERHNQGDPLGSDFYLRKAGTAKKEAETFEKIANQNQYQHDNLVQEMEGIYKTLQQDKKRENFYKAAPIVVGGAAAAGAAAYLYRKHKMKKMMNKGEDLQAEAMKNREHRLENTINSGKEKINVAKDKVTGAINKLKEKKPKKEKPKATPPIKEEPKTQEEIQNENQFDNEV